MVISGAPINSSIPKAQKENIANLIKEDTGFQSLLDYEKKHLIPLNNLFETNGKDLTELERNFFEG